MQLATLSLLSFICLTTYMPVATSSVRKNTKVHYASTAQLLPPELWSAILNQLAASDLQSVIVALSRALPAAEGIKETNKLFRHIVLLRDNQATQLILKLRRLDPDVAQRAKEAACSVTGLAWRCVRILDVYVYMLIDEE